MDTSETYVKMRQAAIPELGQGVPPALAHEKNDDIVSPKWLTDSIYIDHVGNVYYSTFPAGGCQLERQDQLQKMALEYSGVVAPAGALLLDNLYDWQLESNPYQYVKEWFLWSMEQLWLAYVMYLLHNKAWAGEKWEAASHGA